MKVVLHPGLIGLVEADDGAAAPFPANTLAFAEVLRELGCAVETSAELDEAAQVTVRTVDIWIPILTVAGAVGMEAAGQLLAEAISRLLRRTRKGDKGHEVNTQLHLKLGVAQTSASETRWVELHGDAEDVLHALRTLQVGDSGDA